MPNRQRYRMGYAKPFPTNPDPPELAGLSGRQKTKKRKELARAQRAADRRAAGLAQVLEVKENLDVFVDPAAKLVQPGQTRLVVPHRRPPSPRPG